MLPMGTIVTVCMLLGVLCLAAGMLNARWNNLPKAVAWPLGGLVFVAGAWNTFWHGLRHLTDFWGIAALVSGVIMMLAALIILPAARTPTWLATRLATKRTLVLLALLACFLLYAITIFRL